jgi:hypothetical protein
MTATAKLPVEGRGRATACSAPGPPVLDGAAQNRDLTLG